MTATSTAPDTLTTMLTQAEKAQAEANLAAARAAEAQAKAVAVGNQIAAERDARFCAWAAARLSEAPATEKVLAAAVDTARMAFEAAVAGGEANFVAKYLSWAESAARLYHGRTHAANLKGHLHHRRPAEHPAQDAGRGVTHDSRTTVPSITDALARATAMASAARAGDAEDELQAELESALRGEIG